MIFFFDILQTKILSNIFQEVIPEFYSLPEMFTNNNHFNFGKQDDGTVVDTVLLPKWAKSPEDFVRINRMVYM